MRGVTVFLEERAQQGMVAGPLKSPLKRGVVVFNDQRGSAEKHRHFNDTKKSLK